MYRSHPAQARVGADRATRFQRCSDSALGLARAAQQQISLETWPRLSGSSAQGQCSNGPRDVPDLLDLLGDENERALTSLQGDESTANRPLCFTSNISQRHDRTSCTRPGAGGCRSSTLCAPASTPSLRRKFCRPRGGLQVEKFKGIGVFVEHGRLEKLRCASSSSCT